MAKVVKNQAERTGKWVDTAVYFETRDKAGLAVYCKYERAGNFLVTIPAHTIRNESAFQMHSETFFIRRDSLVVGKKEDGAYVEEEEDLYRGKPKLDRATFARTYNYIRMQLLTLTHYIDV